MYGLRHCFQMEEELVIVEAPGRRRRPLRDPLFQSGSDNDVARDHRFTVGGANRKAIDNAVGEFLMPSTPSTVVPNCTSASTRRAAQHR